MFFADYHRQPDIAVKAVHLLADRFFKHIFSDTNIKRVSLCIALREALSCYDVNWKFWHLRFNSFRCSLFYGDFFSLL